MTLVLSAQISNTASLIIDPLGFGNSMKIVNCKLKFEATGGCACG